MTLAEEIKGMLAKARRVVRGRPRYVIRESLGPEKFQQ